MKTFLLAGALAGSFALSVSDRAAVPATQDPQQMQEMMAKAKKFTEPGAAHELLKRFVGEWTGEVRVMMGGQTTPPESGTATFRWLIEGRWLESSWTGRMMGMPMTTKSWMGYDNFRQSYVVTMVSSMDTAMNHAEGDLTPDQKALICYGTVDEYLTGEHDKMAKYVWRFVSDDEIRLEVHDLHIGETGTQVVEVVYKRTK